MTHTPHSNRTEAEDPLSLFAPEDPELASVVDSLETSDVEYQAASVAEEEAFDRIPVGAAAPPVPRWHRHRSSSRLTFAFTVVAVTTVLTGWLLTRKTESAGTRTDVSIPETPRQTTAPIKTVEPPPERARETPVGTTLRPAPESKPPTRAVSEPPKTPAAATIPRLAQPDLGGRDSVTPAARVQPPPQSIVVPSTPPSSSSGTQALATTPVPAVSLPPVAGPAVTTTLPTAAPAAGTVPPSVPTPVAAPPERSPAPEAELARATPPAPAPATIRPRRDLIQSTLDEYRGAVGARNANAVRAVWPKADVKGLTKAFDGVREQTLQLDKCEIKPIIGSTAVATCQGTLTYVRNFGSKTPQVQRQEYQFNLREVNEAWLIDRVVTR